MTQAKNNVQRITEFNSIFMNLNEKEQEAALTVLRALKFAQLAMYKQNADKQRKLAKYFT